MKTFRGSEVKTSWVLFIIFNCFALGLNRVAEAAESGSLRVGAARVDITPAADIAHPPTGKYAHEHLYVRAIVLDNSVTRAALIAVDLGGLSDAIWAEASKEVANELKCPVENILISATHTHSSSMPAAPSKPGDPPHPFVPPVDFMASKMLAAVRQAEAGLQPAQMGYGTGMAYLNVNRDAINPATHLWTQAPNPIAPSDKTVAVLKFETLSGRPIAVYVNYAMHPINGYLVQFVSADFAGAMSRYVEQAYGDNLVVAFTQGASGDQNPLYMRQGTNALATESGVAITGNVLVRESIEAPLRDQVVASKTLDPKVQDNLERWMESEGQVLGEEVIRVMTDTNQTTRDVRIWGAQNTVTCPGRNRTDKGREGMAASYVDGDSVAIRLGVLGVGNVALTSVDAEIYTLISQRMKKQSPMTNTMMVTLANGRANSGYIPDDASFSHNSFQVLSSRLKIGCAESSIADGLTKLVTQFSRLGP